jgi:hypothetical protein
MTMKKTWIIVAILILGALIVFLVAGDFLKNRFEKPAANPYAFSVDEFKDIDPSLILYEEVSRIGLNIEKPRGISWHDGLLCIVYQGHLQIIDSLGVEKVRQTLPDTASCIAVSPSGEVYIGYRNYIEVFDLSGNAMHKWDTLGGNPFITAIAFKDDVVFVADAGNRLVYRYARSGDLLNTIEGKGRMEGNYGFVIPSPYFDLVVDPYDELWVVNPGLHHLENYTDAGALRAYWGEASFSTEGFTGCCNPVHIAVMKDGRFITSEKGLVRIKVYKASGELDCVVAGPDAFDENAEGPDITTDSSDRVYALDYNRNLIRIFETKTN